MISYEIHERYRSITFGCNVFGQPYEVEYLNTLNFISCEAFQYSMCSQLTVSYEK